MKTSEILKKALEILGPNGEHWAKDYYAYDKHGAKVDWDHPNACSFCSFGALYHVHSATSQGYTETGFNSHDAMIKAHLTAAWQDLPEVTFDDVRKRFLSAIKKAEELEAAS